jgi:hypothetical protein
MERWRCIPLPDRLILPQIHYPKYLHSLGEKTALVVKSVKASNSNQSGWGTKVVVEAGGIRQRREIGGQTSCLS